MKYQQHLHALLTAYLSFAYDFLGKDKAVKLDIATYQHLLILMAECIEVSHLADKTLALHAIEKLEEKHTPESASMHCFMLYIARLCEESSKHPLEEGVIKQRIINIFPIFERAYQQQLIPQDDFLRNADALTHIAEKTNEAPAILEAINQEYLRLKQ